MRIFGHKQYIWQVSWYIVISSCYVHKTNQPLLSWPFNQQHFFDIINNLVSIESYFVNKVIELVFNNNTILLKIYIFIAQYVIYLAFFVDYKGLSILVLTRLLVSKTLPWSSYLALYIGGLISVLSLQLCAMCLQLITSLDPVKLSNPKPYSTYIYPCTLT